MATPSATRMAAVGSGGYIVPSGVTELRQALSQPNVISSFDTWKNQGLTKLILSAIRDMIMNQPVAGLDSESVAVQYGVTQGLELAYQLMQDPSIIIPGVFGRSAQPASGRVMPVENFDTSADDAIDRD